MALFGNDDSISEELLKKSMDASKNVQEVKIQDAEEQNPDKDVNNIHGLAYLENNGINASASIDILGDKETFVNRLNEFYDVAKSKYGKIVEAKASMNMSDYEHACEEIKKYANYLGIDELYIMSKLNQQKASKNDSAFIIDHFKEYEDEIMNVIEIIGKYLEKA